MSSRAHLTYFDVRALGEPIRMLLVYGKIPYDEKTFVLFNKNWPEQKKAFPMHQLPMLEIDGMKLHQSKAICRYIARKINLEGDNEKDRVMIDIAADVIYDFVIKLKVPREFNNPEAKAKKIDELKATVFPLYLKSLDDMVKNNGGYFVNGKLTWVDFYFAGATEYYNFLGQFDVIEEYKNLKKLVDTVLSLPQLKDYIEFRPNTKF